LRPEHWKCPQILAFRRDVERFAFDMVQSRQREVTREISRLGFPKADVCNSQVMADFCPLRPARVLTTLVRSAMAAGSSAVCGNNHLPILLVKREGAIGAAVHAGNFRFG